MALDYDAFVHARMERCAYLSVIVFLGYEYLLQFGNEVELFWKKRWTFGKCLFLWSRYYSLGFNIANAIVFMNEHSTPDFCEKFFHWQNTGAALQVITTHIILELRIYAMYGSMKSIGILCCFLTISESIVYGVVFGIAKPGEVATNNPSPGLLICADGDPPHMHWITWFWLTIILIESILLSLSVYKGWTTYRQTGTGSLLFALTRDSVFYFVVIFWVYVMNMIFWFVNVILLDEFATGFSFCVSAVLANRLLISVRERYYNRDAEPEPTMPSMQFKTRQLQTTSTAASASTREPEGSIPMTSLTYGTSDDTGTSTLRSRWDELTNRAEELEVDTYSERRGF